ncbi:ATP-binding protein [Xenophilus arseniciresistens]|uniref:histidine kinase n=1 Tax=Xenophilus arseniciresistens TaxID=1283306 RepID=A0AAE3N9S4_9BURK|nr:ATP-binding protein [Xenophilus arseniciresistens]MDA7417253.1 ATP-binding protein [Xenophilus arseniciresistens]
MSLPDRWQSRWPAFDGVVWYRIDWRAGGCDSKAQPLGASFSYVNMAGVIRLNDGLLWRDQNLVEPLSRSWNMPRAFALPADGLQPGLNRFWVQVVGAADQGSGLGTVVVAQAKEALALAQSQQLYRRVLPGANVLISATLGVFFFMLWLLRRGEKAYGWYAFTALAWVMVGLNNVLIETPWPFTSLGSWPRWITLWLVAYAGGFSMFLWHFGGLLRPWRVRALAGACALSAIAILCLSAPAIGTATWVVFVACVLLILSVCVQFIVHALLRTRELEHLLLAACCAGFLAPAVHDALMVVGVLGEGPPWTPVTALMITLGMSLVLAGHFTRTLRQVERFNGELASQVRLAREGLRQTLEREHALELDNVRLHERLRVAHELHDGLGSSLVRSVALVERSGSDLQRQHYLSMFKSLRDDLRQIIDTHGSAAAAVPDEPAQWLAPIRHRFGRLFDEMGVRCQWQVPPHWPAPLSARQALGLTRLLEEALTNVVKHSRARHLTVRMSPAGAPGGLQLVVEDDGVGFDVQIAQQLIGGLGLGSMHARIERLGGGMQIVSGAGGTRLVAWLRAAVGAPVVA